MARHHGPILKLSAAGTPREAQEILTVTFRGFIQPGIGGQDFADIEKSVQGQIKSGYRALYDVQKLIGQNRIFDSIVDRQKTLDFPYEDQCSSQYYFDIVRTLRDLNGEYDRVVEVGVFMGGSTSYLAGCIEPFDFDLDLVDVCEPYLLYAHERVRRLYPQSAGRIRLFHGDLPTYVREVMLDEPHRRSIVHHDGAHSFDQVVKDMASLSFARESLLAIIAQDTHLRGSLKYMNFVDMALFAVFGTDLKYAPIGKVYDMVHTQTQPDPYFGNYFMPGVAEGVVLPMAANQFVYPHPQHKLDDILPPPLEAPAKAA